MAAIRLSMADNFIRRHAQPIDVLEFDYAFNEEGEKEPILDWYRERQNPDGGFPALRERIGFSTEDCSCLSMTLRNMRHLLLLGFDNEDITQHTLGFIFSHQEDDGAFHEAGAVSFYDVPEWTFPGDRNVLLWQTAASLNYLMQVKHSRANEIFKGYEYLKKYWDEKSGYSTKYYFPLIYALGAFGLKEGSDSERFANCVDTAIKMWQRLPLWEMPLILEICRSMELDARYPIAQKALSRLKASQNPSGYWTDGITPYGSPSNTIFALIALKRYGVI